MGIPHKHAALIKAWADGAEIQLKTEGGWVGVSEPRWDEFQHYRIKPERVFPKTSLSKDRLEHLYDASTGQTLGSALVDVVNSAIKQYILDTEAEK